MNEEIEWTKKGISKNIHRLFRVKVHTFVNVLSFRIKLIPFILRLSLMPQIVYHCFLNFYLFCWKKNRFYSFNHFVLPFSFFLFSSLFGALFFHEKWRTPNHFTPNNILELVSSVFMVMMMIMSGCYYTYTTHILTHIHKLTIGWKKLYAYRNVKPAKR